MATRDFQPPAWLAGPHSQTILQGAPWRRAAVLERSRALRQHASEWLLDCGAGVRLQSFISRVPPARAGATGQRRPVALLLHGWEGSADSLYILSLGQTLFEQGYDVVRLNLRDHGETHGLNRELFHSCRLPEVIGAVRTVQATLHGQPLFLAGYSLGGNFMLRVAAQAKAAELDIASVVAISPVIDPANTLDFLEEQNGSITTTSCASGCARCTRSSSPGPRTISSAPCWKHAACGR
jgi:predicted alpha/beta-fold hydrolase